MNNQDQVSKLNELITANYDAEAGYKQVAERADHATLKTQFTNYAQQRYDFGHEIKDEIAKLGGKVEKGSSVAAGLHRTWIAIKETLSDQGDDEAILEEVVRGEEHALEHYNEVVNALPAGSTARNVVVQQRDKISAAVEEMKVRENLA